MSPPCAQIPRLATLARDDVPTGLPRPARRHVISDFGIRNAVRPDRICDFGFSSRPWGTSCVSGRHSAPFLTSPWRDFPPPHPTIGCRCKVEPPARPNTNEYLWSSNCRRPLESRASSRGPRGGARWRPLAGARLRRIAGRSRSPKATAGGRGLKGWRELARVIPSGRERRRRRRHADLGPPPTEARHHEIGARAEISCRAEIGPGGAMSDGGEEG